MTDKEKLLDKYLFNIAENLDISATMREKAERSYRAVGEWLGDCDATSEVKIMPQGSFYLGTVIRPVSDADEYDIDLVCLLKNAIFMSEAEIKKERQGLQISDRMKLRHTILRGESKPCLKRLYS